MELGKEVWVVDILTTIGKAGFNKLVDVFPKTI